MLCIIIMQCWSHTLLIHTTRRERCINLRSCSCFQIKQEHEAEFTINKTFLVSIHRMSRDVLPTLYIYLAIFFCSFTHHLNHFVYLFIYLSIHSHLSTYLLVSSLTARAPATSLRIHVQIEKRKINHAHKVRDIRRTTNLNLISNVKKSSPTNVHFTLFKYNRAFYILNKFPL